MSGPSRLPQVITDPSQIYYFKDQQVTDEPEQSAIYKNMVFSCAEDKESFGICVTPQCEFGKHRVLFLTFCKIIPFDLLFEYHLKKQNFTEEELTNISPPEKSKNRVKKVLEQFKVQFIRNKTHRYYFLPGSGAINDSFVDFQVIQCVKYKNIKSSDKIAVLVSPWREELPVKYSFYQGRIGTPHYDDKIIDNVLRKPGIPLIESALK